MKIIALRFADNYAPSEGTIRLHEDVIKEYGYVWYGKFGNSISQKIIDMILYMKDRKFLLIKSEGQERYWAHFDDIKKYDINIEAIPEDYRNDRNRVKCWFKITKFEKDDSKVMSKCYVASNGSLLSNISKYSMSPYFVINYD